MAIFLKFLYHKLLTCTFFLGKKSELVRVFERFFVFGSAATSAREAMAREVISDRLAAASAAMTSLSVWIDDLCGLMLVDSFFFLKSASLDWRKYTNCFILSFVFGILSIGLNILAKVYLFMGVGFELQCCIGFGQEQLYFIFFEK